MLKQHEEKKTVLIVDDEADICTTLKRAIDYNGFVASSFTDPILALQHIKLEPARYDIVLSDVRMPSMSGFELARQIKRINPKIKLVIMTAFDINKSEFDSVLPNSAIEGFLTKPVSIEKLKSVLDNL
jgi:two-component system response regulator ChvI